LLEIFCVETLFGIDLIMYLILILILILILTHELYRKTGLSLVLDCGLPFFRDSLGAQVIRAQYSSAPRRRTTRASQNLTHPIAATAF
jgi:hypothetical protein